MEGVTPGTCHQEAGTSFVASTVIVCSFKCAAGGPARPAADERTIHPPMNPTHNLELSCLARMMAYCFFNVAAAGCADTAAVLKISSTGRLSHSVCVSNPRIRMTVAPVSIIETG